MTKNRARYLITTSDESTWKFDRPVIFLGEWCLLYDRKHIWEKMDAIVAEPYGSDNSSRDSDNAQARDFEIKIFSRLCSSLNHYHGKQYSQRFWKILLGHWLRHNIDVTLNRVKTLEKCLQKYPISGMTVYDKDDFSLAPDDFKSTIAIFSDNRWNNILNERILDLLGISLPSIEIIKIYSGFPSSRVKINPSKIFLKWVYKYVGLLLSFFIRDTDAFIINSYLPKKEEVKLHLALSQLPQFWGNSNFKVNKKPNLIIRQKLANELAQKSSTSLIKILSLMIFELMPISFLEGFLNLNNFSKKQHWPKNPKFIFTSNNYYNDDVFKVWAGNKVELGTKYFIGQHGNNNGTAKYLYGVNEEVTSDKYLTWGWTDELLHHTPAFVFKTTGRASGNYNSEGQILLIQLHFTHRIHTWDTTFLFCNYFKEQQDFVSGLNTLAKERLTIRLHPAFRQFNWGEESRWKDFDCSLKVDTSNIDIQQLIAQSRLVIHSYDSTGILETLSLNIPTLAFWQNDLHHLRESAKPYYQLLIDAEIIHFTPESIAQKINEIWNDIDNWWNQKNIQDSRIKFCNQYAKQSQNPINELKKILLK